MRTYSTLLAAAAAAASLAIPVADAAAARSGLTASVNRLDCGSQVVTAGAKACGSVSFTNTTSSSVQVQSPQLDESGASDFAFTSSTCIAASYLAPGESCTVSVAFNPVATGRRSAKLVLPSSLATATTVRLQGLGTT